MITSVGSDRPVQYTLLYPVLDIADNEDMIVFGGGSVVVGVVGAVVGGGSSAVVGEADSDSIVVGATEGVGAVDSDIGESTDSDSVDVGAALVVVVIRSHVEFVDLLLD